MSVINYPSTSPYYTTPQTSWYINHYNFRHIPPNSEDSLMELTQVYEFRPDKLSQDLYNSPVYWWIFAVRNPFLRPDPIWSFVAGTILYCPSMNYLSRILGS